MCDFERSNSDDLQSDCSNDYKTDFSLSETTEQLNDPNAKDVELYDSLQFKLLRKHENNGQYGRQCMVCNQIFQSFEKSTLIIHRKTCKPPAVNSYFKLIDLGKLNEEPNIVQTSDDIYEPKPHLVKLCAKLQFRPLGKKENNGHYGRQCLICHKIFKSFKTSTLIFHREKCKQSAESSDPIDLDEFSEETEFSQTSKFLYEPTPRLMEFCKKLQFKPLGKKENNGHYGRQCLICNRIFNSFLKSTLILHRKFCKSTTMGANIDGLEEEYGLTFNEESNFPQTSKDVVEYEPTQEVLEFCNKLQFRPLGKKENNGHYGRQCLICFRIFNSFLKSTLIIHRKTCKPEVSDSDESISTQEKTNDSGRKVIIKPLKNAAFYDSLQFKLLRKHENNGRYGRKCLICKRVFKSFLKSTLVLHRRTCKPSTNKPGDIATVFLEGLPNVKMEDEFVSNEDEDGEIAEKESAYYDDEDNFGDERDGPIPPSINQGQICEIGERSKLPTTNS